MLALRRLLPPRSPVRPKWAIRRSLASTADDGAWVVPRPSGSCNQVSLAQRAQRTQRGRSFSICFNMTAQRAVQKQKERYPLFAELCKRGSTKNEARGDRRRMGDGRRKLWRRARPK